MVVQIEGAVNLYSVGEVIVKRKSAPSRVAEPALARKNMDMDVAKLEAVRAILGARTDTETVDRALDYVIFQGEVSAALENLYALGGLEDTFAKATPAVRRTR